MTGSPVDKRVDELQFDRNVLRTILVRGSLSLNFSFPAVEEFSLGSIVNGIIENADCGVEPVDIIGQRSSGRTFYSMKEAIDKAITKNPELNLTPALSNSVKRLFNIYQEHCPPDRPTYDCLARLLFKGVGGNTGFCSDAMRSLNKFEQKHIDFAYEGIEGNFDSESIKNLASLGLKTGAHLLTCQEYMISNFKW